jgi:hypothetical protein
MPSAIAQEKLAARARRIRLLRQRIAASVLATFVLAWGVVAFDGSMGAETTTVASTATTTSEATTSATDATTASSEDSTSDDDDSSSAAMTTSQS